MLVMPALHLAQLAVFRLFGVGVVQERLVSVTLGLLMLPIFFRAMARAFGLAEAWLGTIMLAWATSPSLFAPGPYGSGRRVRAGRPLLRLRPLRRGGARFARGADLGGRMRRAASAGVCHPQPVRDRGACTAVRTVVMPKPVRAAVACASCLVFFAAYGLVWWLPHRAALVRLNRFYVSTQVVPRYWRTFSQRDPRLCHDGFMPSQPLPPFARGVGGCGLPVGGMAQSAAPAQREREWRRSDCWLPGYSSCGSSSR